MRAGIENKAIMRMFPIYLRRERGITGIIHFRPPQHLDQGRAFHLLFLHWPTVRRETYPGQPSILSGCAAPLLQHLPSS